MADHEYYQELICAEADGELSPAEEAALRAHLEACADCRRFRDAVRALAAGTAAMTEEPPEGFTAGVMEAVRDAAAPRPAKKDAVLRFPLRPLAFAAAAALVLWAGARVLPCFSGRTAADGAAPEMQEMSVMSAGAGEARPEEAFETADDAGIFGVEEAAETEEARIFAAADSKNAAAAAECAPADPEGCPEAAALAPLAVTIRGDALYYGGEQYGLDALGEVLLADGAAERGVTLLREDADEAAADAVNALLETLEIPVV